jgi:hypothetical protein
VNVSNSEPSYLEGESQGMATLRWLAVEAQTPPAVQPLYGSSLDLDQGSGGKKLWGR